MKEKKDCKIIQDLLPNYIEKLTNEETNQYIKNHLENCKECETIYENMKNKLELDNEKADKREIKFLKKYRNKLRILKTALLIIFIIFATSTARKVIIISNLSSKAEKYESSTNYKKTTCYYFAEGNYGKGETYRLGNKIKVITDNITGEDRTIMRTYGELKILDEQGLHQYLANVYTETKERKTLHLNENTMIESGPQNVLHTKNWWNLLLYAIPTSIRETDYNGEKCYYIANFEGDNSYSPRGMYISKQTGLVIGLNNPMEGEKTCVYYQYEFDKVTEKDFTEPDRTEYTVIND